jgi:hypothetical protein
MFTNRSLTPEFIVLLDTSMVIDLIGYTLLFITSIFVFMLSAIKRSDIKIMGITEIQNRNIGLLLISIGSLIFVLGSLSWRASSGFIPNNFISDYTYDIFIDGEVDSSNKRNLHFIQVILRGLLISNFGLMIYSLGFGSVFDDQRYPYTTELMYIYGILNFIFCLGSTLVIIKPLLTPPLAAIVYWRVISPYHKNQNQFKVKAEKSSITS